MGNPQNNPYSNTYNVGWRNHPNFSWKEQGKSGQGGNFQRPYHNQKLQGKGSQQQQHQEQGTGKKSFEELVESFINQSQSNHLNHGAAIKNLETQVGQMAKQLAERPPGELPSDTEISHIEQCKTISLRSGRNVNVQKTEGVSSESELEKERKKIREDRKKIYEEEREKIREEIREE